MATKSKKKVEEKICFSIEGELTIYRVSGIREGISLALDSASEVEVDLSHVTEIDGAGVQLLIAAKLDSQVRDKHLHFVGHSQPVREALDLCDLGEFFGDPVVIH
ncbi:MAG: STAS domain-containing protein [Pseudomonadota bacterium]